MGEETSGTFEEESIGTQVALEVPNDAGTESAAQNASIAPAPAAPKKSLAPAPSRGSPEKKKQGGRAAGTAKESTAGSRSSGSTAAEEKGATENGEIQEGVRGRVGSFQPSQIGSRPNDERTDLTIDIARLNLCWAVAPARSGEIAKVSYQHLQIDPVTIWVPSSRFCIVAVFYRSSSCLTKQYSLPVHP